MARKRMRKGGKRGRTSKRRKLAPKMRLSRANLKNDIHYFKRYITNPETISGNVAWNPYIAAYSFTFGQLVNVGEYTALFDQYQITTIVVKWYLRIDPSAQTAATASFPKMYYFRDYDDAAPPPTLNNFREHARCQVRVMNPNRPITVRLKPAILQQLYQTAVAAGYGPKWNTWIDMNDNAVPHYGIKWAIDNLTNTNYRVDTEVRIWFKCRGVR